MKITIHRGTDQIGGCVTEYEHNGYRLFVDYGEQLPGYKQSVLSDIKGLTTGDLSKSALLVTHYHGDHIGNINKLPKELPIYIGELAKEIQLTLSKQLSYIDKEKQNAIIERLKSTHCFQPGYAFSFGSFRITPITVDHSAFDAYAFKIVADKATVFHTGDLRTHGFRSGKLENVLSKYIGKVDYLVCEGTNVSRPDAASISERELQQEFEKHLKKKAGHIVYMSSTNIDRLFSFYHSALRERMPFLVDAYQKTIMDIIVKTDSLWGKAYLYQYDEDYPPIPLQRDGAEFMVNDSFKATLSKKGYVLIARAISRFDNLIKRLPDEQVKYLSMWKGYVDKSNAAYNGNLANSLGDKYVYLHTSGHIDMADLKHIFEILQPQTIIPLHTNSPNTFAELFGDKWNVLTLHDGESIFCAK